LSVVVQQGRPAKIVIHTDVFVEHLAGKREPSVLRLAMATFFCYTTVFQAIELFSMARTETEAKAIEDSMSAMKLLGLNPKNARRFGSLFEQHKRLDRWDMLTAGLCVESRLPLLTDRRSSFRGIDGLVVVPTGLVTQQASAADILRLATSKKRLS
jgi:predicted nucleic acid-binding protein